MQPKCFSVIIAGGKGTRFWPLSRSQRPKQLLKILGRRSLISETASRVLSISGSKQTLVVTVAEQLNALCKELPNLPRKNFLAEPQGNNTAPCIGLAALEVVARDPRAVMVVLPADHWVADVNGFRSSIKSAVEIATRHDSLVTIGIRPNYPETGYGYIMKGKPLGGKPGAYHVKRFHEKAFGCRSSTVDSPRLSLEQRHLRLESRHPPGVDAELPTNNFEGIGTDQESHRRKIAGRADAADPQHRRSGIQKDAQHLH